MALFINEEGDKLLVKKQVKVPDKLVDKLTLNKNLFSKYKKLKGFKRISAIVDGEYNKRSDNKEKIHNGDKTISFSDLKRIDHDMRHMSPSKENLTYVIQGGDDMRNWAHDMLRKMRTAVKKVQAVPEVPKIDKGELKPEKPQKDIKIGKASLKITEGKHNKKIIIDENKLILLKEYHDETLFNFDDEGNPYYEKDNYQHYVDFLEEIGKYGELPDSGYDMDDVVNFVEQNQQQAADEAEGYGDVYNDYDDELILDVFLRETISNNEKECFNNDEFWEEIKEFPQSNESALDFLSNIMGYTIDERSCIEPQLTNYGYRRLNNIAKQFFLKQMDDYGFPYGLKMNDRGLIYIEREITIPYYSDQDFQGIGGSKDYFSYLKRNYGGIGRCFTWQRGAAEAYCANSFGGKSTHLLLTGWINPKDIDWVSTIYKNCYGLRNEQEIYVEDGKTVEIDEAILLTKDKKYVNILQKPILVST